MTPVSARPRARAAGSILFALVVTLSAARPLRAVTLPGFRIELVAATSGFCTSIVTDSQGTLYYTTQRGNIYRLGADAKSIAVASVPTEGFSDSGLLGMALADDRTAIVHYTTPGPASDVIARIDLLTGAESPIHSFPGDIGSPGRPVPPEHHGGNPIITPGGTIFFGIGDYGAVQIASQPAWNAGKIWRIDPDGTTIQLARGFRNPFDLAWDPDQQRLIAPDNGQSADDEINIVTMEGGFFGWPLTSGNGPAVDGAIAPVYTFPTIVAPTGIVRLTGANPLLRRGYLLALFVPRAIVYIPDIDVRPLPAPVTITQKDVLAIVDVTESVTGEIFFATGNAIYRLVTPRPGDCNGDGALTYADLDTLLLELANGSGRPASSTTQGTWGCDADADGTLTYGDVAALRRMLGLRRRAV